MKSRTVWLTAGVAALMVGTACQDGDRTRQDSTRAAPGQEVEQAQARSEEAFDSARDAQKEASRQQREAASAQEDLQRKQQELQEAQATAQKESQEAQASQQQAQARTQQAQSEAQQAQASALDAQRRLQQGLTPSREVVGQNAPVAAPVANAQPAAQDSQISGEVLSASAREVLLSQGGEPQLRLQVGPTTQVRVDGRAASAADIQEGAQVRASYRTDANSGEPQALRIDATSRAQPAAPAAPESGESTPGATTPQ
ncbi:hypothetical protein D7Y13_23990 [Corallococcus praedator]|uniref:TolA protein n=1 Tax=Corallococcus praedator TaxID=2316724 RepID=A0ABX9QD54_9BACT|nr:MULTISPECIES: hypothetical protein [Corallococcus]RKH32930.1 hypothetical protein D7X75_13820 [Corallococcus sp. CA031C]RKI02665.1 hypothetical protein D7Y13_23990 [Corallococcus praedator]